MPSTRPPSWLHTYPIAGLMFVHALLALPSAARSQTDWTLLAPTSSPPATTAHAMSYDFITNSMVLFGGSAGGARVADTWLFDGATWTLATPAVAPPARVAHSMTLDLARVRVVMFGGIPAGGGLLGDTWEWDGANWLAQTPTNAPSPRRSFPMVFMPERGRCVLFGGFDTTDLNDLWEWDGSNWAQIVTANSPAPRRASDMAADPTGGGLILFSGFQQAADTWRFDGADWTQLQPTTSPSARYDHSMATDAARGRIVMFAGPGPADTWEWNGSDWLPRTTATVPTARLDTYLAYHPLIAQTFMFSSTAIADTWIYAPTTPASFANSGNGCPGTTTGPPQLFSADLPWLGETFSVDVTPLPAASAAVMTLGFSDTISPLGALPLDLAGLGMPGCLLQIDPAATQFVSGPPGSGSAAWSIAVPTSPGLLGVQFFLQAGAIDQGANAAGFTVSNAARCVIGGK